VRAELHRCSRRERPGDAHFGLACKAMLRRRRRLRSRLWTCGTGAREHRVRSCAWSAIIATTSYSSPTSWATPTSRPRANTPAPASKTVERHSKTSPTNRAPQRRYPAAQLGAPANWWLAEVTRFHNRILPGRPRAAPFRTALYRCCGLRPDTRPARCRSAFCPERDTSGPSAWRGCGTARVGRPGRMAAGRRCPRRT
jgi:hypothetical protein